MARRAGHTATVQEALFISINFLRKQGLLSPDSVNECDIEWETNGRKVGQISAVVNTWNEPEIGLTPHVRLTYSVTNNTSEQCKNYEYEVDLERFPSNLNRGFRYYFRCPVTGKRCSILYKPSSVAGRFAHRSVYHLLYKCQMERKNNRQMAQVIARLHKIDRLGKLVKRTYYDGKKTRNFRRLEKLAQKSSMLHVDAAVTNTFGDLV